MKLCRHFGLDYLTDRLKSNPEKYKDWKFDGCSGLPDEVMGFFTGCDWKDIHTNAACPMIFAMLMETQEMILKESGWT